MAVFAMHATRIHFHTHQSDGLIYNPAGLPSLCVARLFEGDVLAGHAKIGGS
jgi:hypothetical protein